MRINGLLFFSLALMAVILSPTRGSALAVRIADQDPAATARGNAFTAIADNPSAICYNPAGITQLEGNNVSVGVGRKDEHLRWDMACQLAYGPRTQRDRQYLELPDRRPGRRSL